MSLMKVCRPSAKPFIAQPAPPARLPRAVACRAGSDGGAANLERAVLGDDFGARDPTAGEISTNFAEKAFFHWDTEHIIKPPEKIKQVLGLTARSCKDNAGSLSLLDTAQTELLRNQVPGWRISTTVDGKQSIRQEWKAKDVAAAAQLSSMFTAVAAAEGEQENMVVTSNGVDITLELSSKSHGGLTENEFIVAAKINELKVADLIAKKRQRFWA